VHLFLLKREKTNTTLSESFPKSYRTIADQWPLHTNTWSFTFLAWYWHFNKKWHGKIVLWTLISPLSDMMQSCKCFPHVSTTLALTYNWLPLKTTIIKTNKHVAYYHNNAPTFHNTPHCHELPWQHKALQGISLLLPLCVIIYFNYHVLMQMVACYFRIYYFARQRHFEDKRNLSTYS
jgi:hypothetical protein